MPYRVYPLRRYDPLCHLSQIVKSKGVPPHSSGLSHLATPFFRSWPNCTVSLLALVTYEANVSERRLERGRKPWI